MTTDITALTAISGPELLDQLADAESTTGHHINAAHFRERAQQWAADQRRIAELEAENTALDQRLRRITAAAMAA
ncbi:hypothetical protein PQS31_06075 [Luteimonas sp BLCC-B24]|uniref:hypothetical protein n=1 Tax=Luteimonas sp. BLCC-B24 TaxID=3025317 RepID=UPI00234E2F88|nr:hypothetical protein [Luteimonas sp. BLCC-B24]MDC7806390.1 hypothetical protein [Luteimonas sp. BLCC-B24]